MVRILAGNYFPFPYRLAESPILPQSREEAERNEREDHAAGSIDTTRIAGPRTQVDPSRARSAAE
jgi:hypothetical protein